MSRIWLTLVKITSAFQPLGQTDEEASTLESMRQAFRETLGPPLKALQTPIDDWLGGLPMWVALACAIGLYAVALIWVWFLRRDFVFRGAPDKRWWRDLRIWATLVTIPYVLVYLLLGR